MALTIELPQVGESVVEGTIGKWLKQPGDKVERYDPLVEVVTDKVTMDLPSPVSGQLVRILAQEGETVPMGAPIAEIETEENLAETIPAAAPAPAPPETPAPASAAAAPASRGTIGYLVKDATPFGPTGGGSSDTEEVAPTADAVSPRTTPARPAQPAPAPPTPQATNGATRLSPAVRRLAREHQIDLSQVQGSGMGGRITRDDVMKLIDSRAASGIPQAAPAPQPAQAPAAPAASPAPEADEEYVPLTPVRRMIAEAMVRSVTQIPHAWSTVEVDVTNLTARRNSLRDSFQQREGVELTYLPFIIKMVVESLKENPTLNATWGGDKVILKKRIHMGIAVAAPEGLIVPVIHDADRLSISGLAHALRDLTTRARERRLRLEDVQGGTFTLNNTGVLGSTVSQPIINYPQAAILTTEAIQKRPVVINDAIAIRSMMNLCMSFDHRINDGAEASTFLQSVKRHLESISPDMPVY
jgi:2-oxoisovalerate dehydrogenase E2 component (dihydrolipoyl transacylase)